MMEWKKCENCGMIQHPTHIRCVKCKNENFSSIKVEGNGKLITYTLLTAPPAEFRNKGSYYLGVFEFNNGIKAIGQIENERNLVLGMKMRAFQKKICDNLDGQEVIDYVFKPID
jgi:uncharacterized OB-fold protein